MSVNFDFSTVAYVEIDSIGIVILSILIYNSLKFRSGKFLPDQKLFFWLLMSNLITIVFDLGMWAIDKRVFFGAIFINNFVSCIYYILNPLTPFLWLLYTEYKTFGALQHSRLRKFLIFIPFLLNAAFSVVSVFSDSCLFTIDANNVYSRSDLFFITPVLSYSYLIAALIIVLVNRKKLQANRHESVFASLFGFVIPPLIGSVIQVFFFGISLIWICTAIALLITFTNLQNRQMFTDYLTGLFNRRQLESYLSFRMKRVGKNELLAGIMIDIDRFKSINDIYGHTTGDRALEQSADILRSCLEKGDFLARYGGDEFVLIFEVETPAEINARIQRIKSAAARFNASDTNNPYEINFSMGVDIFSPEIDTTVEKFIRRIDVKMYENKQSKRLNS